MSDDAGQKFFNSQFAACRVSLDAVTESQIPDPDPGPGPRRQTPDATSGFWALFVTQFQGALSDNVLKWLVVFMILGMNVSTAELHRVGELVTALFSLPFILFSMAGGFFADRFSKRTISVSVKIFEIGVMLLALTGFWLNQIPVLLGCVFLMGVHSSFFGPSKYGLLPELLPERKLSWGNGLIELGTFLAIILGTVAAAQMSKHFHGQQAWSGIILIALAVIGFSTSLGITRVPAADPGRKFRANFLSDLFAQLRLVRRDRPLTLAFLGNTYFFFLGQLLQLNVFFYGAQILHLDEIGIGQLSIALALGIGLGSVAAGYLSGGKIEYGLVPLGAFGMSLVSVWLSAPGLPVNAALVRLALLGFAGGFFIVPIAALLQHRPDPAKKGEVLAAANLLSFVGIFLASGAYYLLADVAGLSPVRIFLFGGLLTLAGAIYVLFLLPDALLRFLLWCATHSFYRIRIVGRDNIPAKGGALFVCNHVSWMDALLLIASTDRPVRFLMFKDIYEQALDEAVRAHPRRHSHFLRTASARIDPFAANRQRRDPQRRGRLHFCRGPNHAHRPVAAVPARHGTHHEGRGRAHRAGGARRRARQPVQLQTRALRLEIARAPAASGHGQFWPAAARERDRVCRAAGRAGIAGRRLAVSPRPDATAAARSSCGRRGGIRGGSPWPTRNNAKVTFGAALVKIVFLARRLKKIWAGQNHGRNFPAAVRARRAGELRRAAPAARCR